MRLRTWKVLPVLTLVALAMSCRGVHAQSGDHFFEPAVEPQSSEQVPQPRSVST